MSHADEHVSASTETTVRARKPHRCCACHETIRVGDEYTRIWCVHEGAHANYKRCLRCSAIWKAIDRRSQCDPILFDLGCRSTWEQEFGEPAPDDVAALAFALPGEVTR